MNAAINRDRKGAGFGIRVALYAVWLMLALFLALRHVVWRDELRALTFALQGDTIGAMLRNLHGEGHPALWYLMLRGAHALWPHPQVLVTVASLARWPLTTRDDRRLFCVPATTT